MNWLLKKRCLVLNTFWRSNRNHSIHKSTLRISGLRTKSTCSRPRMQLEEPSMNSIMVFSLNTLKLDRSNWRRKLHHRAMVTQIWHTWRRRSARHSCIKTTTRWSKSTASGPITFQFTSLTTTNALTMHKRSQTLSTKKWSSKIATKTGSASSNQTPRTIWSSVLENFSAKTSSESEFTIWQRFAYSASSII